MGDNYPYLCTGDDDGKVNLYRYPCPFPKAPKKSYGGHSSHVTRVKFSYDNNYVYTTGGNDKCVMVWKTDFGIGKNQEE